MKLLIEIPINFLTNTMHDHQLAESNECCIAVPAHDSATSW